jgi:hypothetical protein
MALVLGLWLCLAGAAGGCHSRGPAPQGGGAGTDAAARGQQTGQPDQGAKEAAPANAPSGAPKAGGEGAKVESPFPGQSGGDPAGEPTANTAGAGSSGARTVARRDPDTIPGVPRLRLPPPRRSPFRLEGGKGEETAPEKAPPEVTIRLRDSDKPTGGLLGVQPLPPMSATAPGLAPHEGVRVPGSVSSPPEGGAAAAATSPALQLTGIIDGDPRLAVIEGETAHYIVREGDRVVGGYRVASISPYKVMLLSDDSRTVILRFGRKGG